MKTTLRASMKHPQPKQLRNLPSALVSLRLQFPSCLEAEARAYLHVGDIRRRLHLSPPQKEEKKRQRREKGSGAKRFIFRPSDDRTLKEKNTRVAF